MLSLIFVGLGASSSALSNLFFRRCSGGNQTTDRPGLYLVCYYFFSFLFSCLLNPSFWTHPFNGPIFAIGGCVGLLNVSLMWCITKALQRGPAGLTFAFQNASAVFPGIFLFFLFGENFGFTFSMHQIFGLAVVLIGLFLGTKNSSENASYHLLTWLIYALGGFLFQVVALMLIQGRCILFECEPITHFFLLADNKTHDDSWFMPGQFGIAFLVQCILFWREKESSFAIKEGIYGLFGGLANFASTTLLLLATKWSLPKYQIILLPFFAVINIILCNLWANRLYNERFNFKMNVLCGLGIFFSAL